MLLRGTFKLFKGLISGLGFVWMLALWALLVTGIVFALSTWYNYKESNKELIWGMSWSTKRAQTLGLSADTTANLDAILNEIPIRRLQLMSYWDVGEPEKGTFNFSQLEEQFAVARRRGLRVSLQLGLHQSVSPFCHQPAWTQTLDQTELTIHLQHYLQRLIERFDNEVNLVQYQLEPEIFRVADGTCTHQLQVADLDELYQFVTTLTEKEVAVSLANNRPIVRRQTPNAGGFGLRLTPYAQPEEKWYQLQRTLPARYYNFLAGNFSIFHSSSRFFIRQLVIEPVDNLPFSAELLQQRLDYAASSNLKTIDLQGAEWWLQQTQQGDNSLLELIAQKTQPNFQN